MPPAKDLNQWRIHIDGDNLDDKATAFFKKRSDAYILVHHTPPTENPHYHCWVKTHVTQGNMANFIKKEFSVTGSDYSCVKCAPDRHLEYKSYLFNTKKGNVSRLVSYEGVSPIDVETARETANQIAAEFATRMASVKKLTKFDIAEKLSDRSYGCTEADISQLFDDVVKLLHDNRMCSATFVVRDIMTTVFHMTGSKEAKNRAVKFFLDT